MTVTSTAGRKSLDQVLSAVRQALRSERKRTEIERDAFGEFATRIDDLRLSDRTSVSGVERDDPRKASGTVTLQSQPISEPRTTDKLDTIRNAYEQTVMSVPFYEAEYGDTYQESIRAEFGPDIATALTETSGITPAAKEVLRSRIEHARSEREALIETYERERRSVDEAAAGLKPIDRELWSVEASSFDEQGFGALEAQWTRLMTLEDKCEHVAAERQATIHRHRTEHDLPVEAPDICAYLYEEFETAYPILSLYADLAHRVDNCRRRVESAMSAGN